MIIYDDFYRRIHPNATNKVMLLRRALTFFSILKEVTAENDLSEISHCWIEIQTCRLRAAQSNVEDQKDCTLFYK